MSFIQVVLRRAPRKCDVRAIHAQEMCELQTFVQAEQPSSLILGWDSEDLQQPPCATIGVRKDNPIGVLATTAKMG
jgi:hypothetical protein